MHPFPGFLLVQSMLYPGSNSLNPAGSSKLRSIFVHLRRCTLFAAMNWGGQAYTPMFFKQQFVKAVCTTILNSFEKKKRKKHLEVLQRGNWVNKGLKWRSCPSCGNDLPLSWSNPDLSWWNHNEVVSSIISNPKNIWRVKSPLPPWFFFPGPVTSFPWSSFQDVPLAMGPAGCWCGFGPIGVIMASSWIVLLPGSSTSIWPWQIVTQTSKDRGFSLKNRDGTSETLKYVCLKIGYNLV